MTEFGLTVPKGIGKLGELMTLVDADEAIPERAWRAVKELHDQCDRLVDSVAAVEGQIVAHARHDESARRLATIPGIDPITASLIVATVVDFCFVGADDAQRGLSRKGRVSRTVDGSLTKVRSQSVRNGTPYEVISR